MVLQLYTQFLIFSRQSLLHEPSLSIPVGIYLWVYLIHHAWLAGGSIGSTGRPNSRTYTRSSAGGTRTSRTIVTNTAVILGQGCSTLCPMTSKCSPNRSGLALEGISALLTASERSTLTIELIHSHSWERGSSVVLGLVLVNFMHRLGGVYNGRLDGILLDDWLDVLVNVVVDMFAGNGWCSTGAVLSLTNCATVLELSLLSSETLFDVRIVTVLDVTVLSLVLAMVVFFWENLAVLNRLNGGVVMILVNFSVYCLCDILMLGTGNVLVLNCRVDSLVNRGIVLSILVEEVSNSCLGLFHFD